MSYASNTWDHSWQQLLVSVVSALPEQAAMPPSSEPSKQSQWPSQRRSKKTGRLTPSRSGPVQVVWGFNLRFWRLRQYLNWSCIASVVVSLTPPLILIWVHNSIKYYPVISKRLQNEKSICRLQKVHSDIFDISPNKSRDLNLLFLK